MNIQCVLVQIRQQKEKKTRLIRQVGENSSLTLNLRKNEKKMEQIKEKKAKTDSETKQQIRNLIQKQINIPDSHLGTPTGKLHQIKT